MSENRSKSKVFARKILRTLLAGVHGYHSAALPSLPKKVFFYYYYFIFIMNSQKQRLIKFARNLSLDPDSALHSEFEPVSV